MSIPVGVSIFTIIMGTMLFSYAMHTNDLAFNWLNIEKNTGFGVSDTDMFGNVASPEAMHVRSFLLAPVGFIITIAGIILFMRSFQERPKKRGLMK